MNGTIGCLNKPKGLRPIVNEKVVGTLNFSLVNEKNGNKSIDSTIVQKCLKLEPDQMSHLPTAICTHCRIAMLNCKNIADYPISVRYTDLIDNVKSNTISKDNEECICEICLLGSVRFKTKSESQFLLDTTTKGNPLKGIDKKWYFVTKIVLTHSEKKLI